MTTTATPSMDGWEALRWKPIEREVFKLQKRIYQASRRGDRAAVHRLQRLLLQSWSAKCLAVRRVTQDNRGKKTAGIDGVCALTPAERLDLVRHLTLDGKAQPVRRVWIPKPGTTEKRGLGIPVMYDRACQALVKLALEPEWEAKFEANSYGFRPGRSCWDAIQAIFGLIKLKPKYALDADIAKCFDRIDHSALLAKLETFPTVRQCVKGWLEAGVMDGPELFPTEAGTPQGGVISPLLANIALHGLAQYLADAFPRTMMVDGKRVAHWTPVLVRYADDLVVLHQDLGVIQRCQELTSVWLRGMGLELKPSKTCITHTLQEHEGHVGFDFLGFSVRQYPVGQTHSGKSGGKNSHRLGHKTLIKPSKAAIRRHLLELRQVIKAHQIDPQAELIRALNPKIRGWTRYFCIAVAGKVFSQLTTLTFRKLWSWAKRRHGNKPHRWIARKYWHRTATTRWCFRVPGGPVLFRHQDRHIQRHTKVRGDKSPYDGDWVYWSTRMGAHPEVPSRVAALLRRQGGRCARCGLVFKEEDRLETDHIIPQALGGRDNFDNCQLLHGHCHDQKTRVDAIPRRKGTDDNSQTLEEPDDAKVSRPVLKPSRPGDRAA